MSNILLGDDRDEYDIIRVGMISLDVLHKGAISDAVNRISFTHSTGIDMQA